MISLSGVSSFSYLVLGYGKSCQAAAKALSAGGAKVLVWDDKDSGRQAAAKDGFALGEPGTVDFASLKALVAAPGIPLTHPLPHPAVAMAREKNVPVISDLDLLFAACPDATYLAVTGTNGKSTTTALIAHILEQAGRKVQMGGNIGVPALSLEALGKDGIYVLETSSYQLDLIQTKPFDVGVWLNVTPDHIDRHGDMAGYIKAKKKIVREDLPQTLVLGTDEPEMERLAEELATRKNLKLSLIKDLKPIDLSESKSLLGAHNAQNASASFLACEALGLTPKEIKNGIDSFPGLDHRQKLVREIGGVRFINDSKATNANAASKALVCYEPIYWIVGGKPKAGGLAGLEPFAPRIAHAFLIGEAEADFALWCQTQGLPFTRCGTLDVALQKAATTAWYEKKKDAVVLLSPACASFDQFASFEERGERFAEMVLSLEAGG